MITIRIQETNKPDIWVFRVREILTEARVRTAASPSFEENNRDLFVSSYYHRIQSVVQYLLSFRRIIVGLARHMYHKVNATRWGSSIASSRRLGWLRSKFVVMRGTDVHTVVDTLRTAGVEAWIAGGWGVDALLGVRTRRHEDLDVIVEAGTDSGERAVQALAAIGFRLAAETDGKVALLVSVTKDLTDRVKAGDLVKTLAPIVGGGGGGRPDFAEAGGKEPAKIDELMSRAKELLEKALS